MGGLVPVPNGQRALSALGVVVACGLAAGSAVAQESLSTGEFGRIDQEVTRHTVISKSGGLLETLQSASGTLEKADRHDVSEASDRTAGLAGLPGQVARRLVDIKLERGRVLLNSYGTRTMPFDTMECAGLGWEIVAQLSVPADAIHPLASDDLMHQMRVCAANGSILITCYNGTATISLREPRQKDGCGG